VTFRHAIVRPPAATFAAGLTTAGLGSPDLALARSQHRSYCEALLDAGLALTWLPEDEMHPDSTFVEDTAVLARGGAILARPGADERAGEVDAIRPALGAFFPAVRAIEAPGTLDGGDVCEAGDHVFIGISERTNEAGALQLETFLRDDGYDVATVDIRGLAGILHLKSGVAALDARCLALVPELRDHAAFRAFDRVVVAAEERYAANAVRVNDLLLIAGGFPRFERELRRRGLETASLDMSEFRKMDGGLSCLSLRF
jgi:dimethylargininase